MNTNFSRLLLAVFLAIPVCAARADQEQDLIAVLKSSAGTPQKCIACEKLRLVGTVNAVPVLAGLLTQEATGHAARYALEGLPFPEAVAALRTAAGTTSGSLKAGLLDSLGWRRDAASVALLKKSLSDQDPVVASAAAVALGRIGDKKASAALTSARGKVVPAARTAVLDGIARCADQFLADGDAKGAASLYRLVLSPESPDAVRAAAWRGLAMADVKGRGDLVCKALAGSDRPLHIAALKTVRELNDAALVDACWRQWSALPGDAQLAVLDARVKVGGAELAGLLTAAQSPHLQVRVAAWRALGDLGTATAVPALAKAAAAGAPAEREAARESLARIRGGGALDALLAQLNVATPQEKVEVLHAFGDRGDAKASAVLLQNTAGVTDDVRLASLESLRKLADPNTAAPLLNLAAKSKSEADCEPVLKALYAVCQASANKDQVTATILGAMNSLSSAERAMVLPVLSELATPAALEAVVAATREQNSDLVKQAIRVLAQWPNAAPADTLLGLASSSNDSVLQVLALRGCIDVSAQEPDPAKRLALLQKAMAAAKRVDEKKQALGQVGQIPTRDALQFAMSYLTNADLANEAGLAAVTTAEKLAATDPQLAHDTAEQVLAQCRTPAIVKRAWAIRGKPPGNGAFLQDWLVSGPYTKSGVTGAQAYFDLVFPPEESGGKAQWKPFPRGKMAELSGFFPGQENCVAYLKAEITSPRDCDATLLLGSDDGVKAWLNGAVVHGNNVDRGLAEDQDVAPIQLKQGANELLLKITQGGGGWGACARIVGADGQPIKGLKSKAQP